MLVKVFASDTKAAAAEIALVLQAVDIKYELHPEWEVWVDEHQAALAHQHIQHYWQENQPTEKPPVTAVVVDSGWLGVLGYLLVIWAVPALQSVIDTDLRLLGRLDASLIRDGEWWRTMTSLTLHADLAHIAANSLFGTLFGLFVGRYLGSGFGWLLVLLCGGVANLANGLLQAEGFRAIGASTATFAALGLVPAFGWRRGFFRGRGWKRGFAPLFAAIAILSYTGFGGGNTDVVGHVFGFIMGIVVGLGIANTRLEQRSLADQQRAGAFAMLLVVVSWLFAFSS